MQQTPNPEAQDPDAVPPYEEHSELVRQVPLYELVPVHKEFGNRTIENIDKTVHIKKNRFSNDFCKQSPL